MQYTCGILKNEHFIDMYTLDFGWNLHMIKLMFLDCSILGPTFSLVSFHAPIFCAIFIVRIDMGYSDCKISSS